jgi:hypothetical protein
MEVETLGDAFTHSWRIMARCSGGVEDNRTHRRPCIYREGLDLHTLVWTLGRSAAILRFFISSLVTEFFSTSGFCVGRARKEPKNFEWAAKSLKSGTVGWARITDLLFQPKAAQATP